MSKQENIIFFGNSHLRAKCSPVSVFHKGLHNKIDIISNTLRKHGGGAALAAPQIALLKRIIVIDYLGEYYELINPEIIEKSGEQSDFEGCLSLPGFVGKVNRYKNIKVKYQDRFGESQTIETSDQMARCFQHEIDHLDGILYIDRMSDEYIFNDETNEKTSVKHFLDLTRERSST
ncbi:peptide deformylase [Marispirochaeta aestuarii]|uniref:peptide deformylase n=1 Tax=Marispirochaeta aestuarii TaxID=1963862 RepID=UPI002ABE145E|nr:peptide deformylase [Marispirochaeta aestuarii]